MILGSPPLQVGQQLWGGLRRGPGATRQRCHPMADGQIDPLDTSGVESTRETQSLQGDFESRLCPQAHHMRDSHQLAPPVAFFHLAIYQARRYLPLAYMPPSPNHLKPLAKMGCEGIEVQIEAITGEERQTERRPGFVAGSG